MLKTFLAASASSALAITLTNHLSRTSAKSRTPNTISLFSNYDGNILGGALLGAGMALSSACPGTVLPQLAAGIPSAPNVILGTFLGGILYSRFGKPLQQKVQNIHAIQKPTIYDQLGISRIHGLVAYEIFCLTIIYTTNLFEIPKPATLVPASIGGILIGLSQFTSLLLTSNTLGISTAYEQIGDLFWWSLTSSSPATHPKESPPPQPSIKSTFFALGTFLGSRLFHLSPYTIPEIAGNAHAEPAIGTLRAIAGGVALIFGSRIAGGCTSGHGISGMSLGSVSSCISVISMFAGGIAVTKIID